MPEARIRLAARKCVDSKMGLCPNAFFTLPLRSSLILHRSSFRIHHAVVISTATVADVRLLAADEAKA